MSSIYREPLDPPDLLGHQANLVRMVSVESQVLVVNKDRRVHLDETDNLEEMEIEVNQDLLDLADHRVDQDHREVLDPEEIQDHVVNEERPDNQATMELQVRKYFKALKVFLHEF